MGQCLIIVAKIQITKNEPAMPDDNEDQFQFEQFQKRAKQKLFMMTGNFLEHCESINPVFIYLLIVVEALQILWFSIHPRLEFLKNPTMLQFVRTALGYLNFEWNLQKQNELLLPFVVVSAGIVALHIATVVVSAKLTSKSSKDNSEFSVIVCKAAAIEIILINSVLTIPIWNVSIITLYCDNSSPYHTNRQCYDVQHIILCVLSVINVLVLLFESAFYWYLFYLRNPFSKSYYALSNNLFRLGKLLLKILPPLYFLIDFNESFRNVYIFVFLILSVLYLGFFRILGMQSFYKNFFYLEVFMESMIVWFCINTVICYEIESSGTNFIESFLCSLLFAYTVCTVQSALTKRFLINNIDGQIKKQDRQKLIYLLISILFAEPSSQEINPIVYIKMLNSNLNICSIKIRRFLSKTDLKTEEVQELSREIMIILLDKFFEDDAPINLKMVKCQLLYDCNLRILSLHEVSQLRNDKLSTYEQFMIHMFKATRRVFESTDIKGIEDNITQIETYLRFVEYMNSFETELDACAQNNEQYWEELCEDIPSTNKVYNLANRSMKFSTKIEEIFKKIEEIFPENLSSLILYYQFLNDVCVKYKECNKIKEKLFIEQQRLKEKESSTIQNHNLKIKFKANERMCVLQVSTTTSSLGIVSNCNSEVKRYLGFEKSQIINQKVTKIMPKLYSEIHDGFIEEYLKKADAMKLPSEKTVFAFKKSLAIIETSLAVKIFPNVLSGFQLVGFFKEKNFKQDVANIMLNLKTNEVQGMTQSFLKMTDNRIKLSQIQKQPLKLSHLFPQIEPNHAFKVGEQIQTTLRFSDCTDKLIQIEGSSEDANKKFEKVIYLEVSSINSYQKNVQVVVLTVHDEQASVSLKEMSHNDLRVQKNNKQRKEMSSMSDTNYHQQISIERKVETFLGSKSNLNKFLIIKIMIFICFASLAVASILMNSVKATSNQGQTELFQEIYLSMQVTILEGKILSLNSETVRLSNNQAKWQVCKNLLQLELKKLQETVLVLFEKANERRDFDLVINRFQHYDFLTIFKKQGSVSTTTLYYNDGIQQAVFLGTNALASGINNFVQPYSQGVIESRFFIEENMKKMLPDLGIATSQAYRTLLNIELANQFIAETYFVSIRSILLLMFFIGLCIILSRFAEFNQVIIEFYNNIYKWDAYELYSKCQRFRNKSLQVTVNSTTTTAPRNSDLFKVFPKSLLVLLSQGIVNRISGKTSIMSHVAAPKADTQNKQEMQKLNTKQKEEETNAPSKGDLVHLTVQNSMNKKYMTAFLFLLVIVALNFVFLYLNHNFKNEMSVQKDKLVNLGMFSKSFLFTYFYGARVVSGADSFRQLFNTELDSFYRASKNISLATLGQQSFIRDVYLEIEFLNSLIKGEVSLDASEQARLLQASQEKLFRINDNITQISQQILYNANTYLEQSKNQIRYVKMSLDIILILIFYRLVLSFLLLVIENQIKHSCNMMRMVPTWIISKNKKLKDIISLTQTPESKPDKKPTLVEDTAHNLMNTSDLTHD